MTSANCSSSPSWLQLRCSQSWHEAKRTGVPSVSVIASTVRRALAHAGHMPVGRAWVSEDGVTAVLAARRTGKQLIGKTPVGGGAYPGSAGSPQFLSV